MSTLSTNGWSDYELLDSGFGRRLERFGEFKLVRPFPEITWKPTLSKSEWDNADAQFEKKTGDKGEWKVLTKVPEKWLLQYNQLSFYCKLKPFKHTGVFPEQSIQWDWMQEKIRAVNRQLNVLNLFGYTGIASLAAAQAGAKVTHVDASYPTIGWARENQQASELTEKPIRWILDDALKFCAREVKRGNKYDGIVMDPPAYGHGPKGERWDFNTSFPQLLDLCNQLLSPQPLFLIVNAYAISHSPELLGKMLQDQLNFPNSEIETGTLALQEKNSKRLLTTGIFARRFSV